MSVVAKNEKDLVDFFSFLTHFRGSVEYFFYELILSTDVPVQLD